MPHQDDTIAAIATPAGVGAISVIRVSGNTSMSAVEQIFKGKQRLADAVGCGLSLAGATPVSRVSRTPLVSLQ